jgi:lysophospholipase L1-like esterase
MLWLDGELDEAVSRVAGMVLPSKSRSEAGAKPAATTAPAARAQPAPSARTTYTEPVTVGQTPAANLERFFNALAELETGRRTRPVTVLHLGDGHVSGDRLDHHMRLLLQARFGDAGRGLLLPSNAFNGYRARGLRFDAAGQWATATSLDRAPAVLGLTGVQTTATGKDAEIAVTSLEGAFDQAEVTFLSSPDRGAASVSVDGRAYSVATRAPEVGVQGVRIAVGGKTLSVRPAGTGGITVLSWAMHKNQPGIRYVGLGMPGATLAAFQKADELLLAKELRALKPELVVIGYGGTEAHNDRLDVAQFAQSLAALAERFKALAPEASLLLLGPADSARIPSFTNKLTRQSTATGCRALTTEERASYASLWSAQDERLQRWHPPLRLEDVRLAMQRVALTVGAYYWDWSKVMGGACGIHAWVHARPELAMADHVTLTDEGYQRSAKALFSELIQGYSAQRQIAVRPQ